MITCWHCTATLLDGTIFCDDCGAALLDGAPRRCAPPPAMAFAGAGEDRPRGTPRLILADTGEAIPLPPAPAVVLGRAGDRGPAPDVDLGPFRAADAGVSRAHLMLDLAGPRALIEDLASTNGTYVNGRRIAPHSPIPVSASDRISLGQLSVRLEL